MRNSDYVVVIVQDGRVLKESRQGVVSLPFESEYDIRLRNKSDRDAVAQIYLDGENISGEGFIVRAGRYVDIERPADKSCKFRFVSADSEEAVDGGKNNQLDDRNGIVEVHWRPKKERRREPAVPVPVPWPRWPYWPKEKRRFYCGSSKVQAPQCVSFAGVLKDVNTLPGYEEGCTVEGSRSDQKCVIAYIGELVPTSQAVILRILLKGYRALKSNKAFCVECGHQPQTNDKFCGVCGRHL